MRQYQDKSERLNGVLERLTQSVKESKDALSRRSNAGEQELADRDCTVTIERTDELQRTAEERNQKRLTFADTELTARKKIKHIEKEIQQFIEKYDAEMTEERSKIDRLTESHKAEQTSMADMQAKTKIMKAERERIEQEAAAAKREEEAAKRQTDDAATKIQSAWRGHHVRKGLDNGKGKKTKGKSKKR